MTGLTRVVAAAAFVAALAMLIGWWRAERRADRAEDARDAAIKQSARYWEALRRTQQQLDRYRVDETEWLAPFQQPTDEQATAVMPAVQPRPDAPASGRRNHVRPVYHPRRNHNR